ncbi:MAG TPA: GNAT family N-acetyltransferase, partial [Methylomirabilota bacterium]|nr:GNAT family N-acetyltransferase [Methylomirabilota bacterium]
TNSDLDQDALIVERDGAIVGYARVEWRERIAGTRGFASICALRPSERRQGIGRAMLGWCEDRLAAKAAALADRGAVPGVMQAFAYGNDTGAIALLEATGWTRTGHGYEMVRPTMDDIPDVPMPDGLETRPASIDEAARRAVWDAAVEAFRDHRDEPEVTDADWLQFLKDPDHDPSLWLVAWDGDEIAGAVLGKIDPAEHAHHGRERGIVDEVFTRRAWRRRGLARALVARTLVRLRDHGMTSAYLGVDGLNPNQAMTLYSSLGFERSSMSIDWTKPLPEWTGVPAPAETP